MHMLMTSSSNTVGKAKRCYSSILPNHIFYAPAIFNGGWGGGGHIASPLSVRTSVRNTFGFRAVSFERIGVLD